MLLSGSAETLQLFVFPFLHSPAYSGYPKLVCSNEKESSECHNKVCCGWHFEQFVPYNDEEQRHEEYAYGDKNMDVWCFRTCLSRQTLVQWYCHLIIYSHLEEYEITGSRCEKGIGKECPKVQSTHENSWKEHQKRDDLQYRIEIIFG